MSHIKTLWNWIVSFFRRPVPIFDGPAHAEKIKIEFQMGDILTLTPGKRHAWFNSSIGRIRKPI